MKTYKQVEATRRKYHADPLVDSVHRSSLMVPELPPARATISFLNHFLLKRGYPHVGCKLTAIGKSGERLASTLLTVDEPRVYCITLADRLGVDPARVSAYMVEFFAAENLFIPFPAVMVNHEGDGFLNTVHSFNRVLNDCFENDQINETHTKEAFIRGWLDETQDSFFVVQAGPQACNGELAIEVQDGDARHVRTVHLSIPRLCQERFVLRELIPEVVSNPGAILRVLQPQQFLLYNRLLCGLLARDGSFTANHSYYDSSESSEYWPGSPISTRKYPFIPEIETGVRVYPIMSPSKLTFSIALYDADGLPLAQQVIGYVTSPSGEFLDASVKRVAAALGLHLRDIASFAVRAETSDVLTGVPSRIGHQIVFDSGQLETSIGVSLMNDNDFTPSKPGVTWGQIPLGHDLETWVSILWGKPRLGSATIRVRYFSTAGAIGEEHYELPADGCITLSADRELRAIKERIALDGDPAYAWFYAESPRNDITSYTVVRHRRSGHCTGEHSF